MAVAHKYKEIIINKGALKAARAITSMSMLSERFRRALIRARDLPQKKQYDIYFI